MSSNPIDFFVSCAPGLEQVLIQECRTLGFSGGIRINPSEEDTSPLLGERGGVQFSGSIEQVMLGNLHLRTASRILVRHAEFYAASFSELEKRADKLEWTRFLHSGQSVNIRVTCHKSKLYHSDAVAERVLKSINRVFSRSTGGKQGVRLTKGGQTILVRLVHDMCTISIDSSGELLHKRGYRQETAKAPLRETLASGLILAAGWDGLSPLIDPFCGAGTIPIEAALIATGIPSGIGRNFAFMDWPEFRRETWEQMVAEARSKVTETDTDLLGYDRDAGAVNAAISNASRAGQKDNILFRQQPISLLEPAQTPGWVITNPPYGVRVSNSKDLRDLYARFGTILKTKFVAWKLGILCNDPRLLGNLALGEPIKTVNLINGGIPVKFSIFEIG